MKICPVRANMFHADRRTDGHIDMTKLIVAFRNSAKVIKKRLKNFHVSSCVLR